jgi:hypothetical protein
MRKHCKASDDDRNREQHCRHGRPAQPAAMFLQRLELFWQLRIADLISVKIDDTNACSVLHFACSKIVN